ncbi:uncharacterized protein LOC128603074 isoform X2 [Ictalurus furcatus]|uniref:uncharacterized protein LOC128603074 isoform X2 n=1 Tax=Ictalurus furcatus TaxID=66913 RepID=UPI0023503682|nr:uncharacterized protein LOC128603074 isoform X2 [Ictalurus furcatus]
MIQAMIRFFVMVLGNTVNSHKTFMERLTISQKLRGVNSVNDSDVIIAFVPIVSRAGTDIGAAMAKIPQGKPVVLVVLHHTFDPDYIAPDSRLCVNTDRVFAVDCLYHEDQGLLKCLLNDDAIRAVKKHLRCDDHIEDDSSCARCVGFQLCISDAETGGAIYPQFPRHGTKTRVFSINESRKFLDVQSKIEERLKKRLQLHQVDSEDYCDVIMAFVPIVSRAGTDIEAALQNIPTNRPVILVVLHHTFDENYIVPQSKRCVNRDGVFAADFLCHEDKGLLECLTNEEALKSVSDYLVSMEPSTPLIPVNPRPPRRRSICLGVFAFLVVVVIIALLIYFIQKSHGHGDTQTTVIPPITVTTHQPNITETTQQSNITETTRSLT